MPVRHTYSHSHRGACTEKSNLGKSHTEMDFYMALKRFNTPQASISESHFVTDSASFQRVIPLAGQWPAGHYVMPGLLHNNPKRLHNIDLGYCLDQTITDVLTCFTPGPSSHPNSPDVDSIYCPGTHSYTLASASVSVHYIFNCQNRYAFICLIIELLKLSI